MPKRTPKGTMKRLADGIYERDGRKLVKWWEPDGNGGGARRQETLPEGTTLAEAKTFKGDRERDKRRAKKRDETADSFAERWTRDYPRRSASTNKQNNERVRKFKDDFAGRNLREIDRAEMRLWVNQNPGRYKAVRAMLNDALQDGFIDENVILGLHRGAERGRADIVVVTAAELDRMAELAVELHGEYGHVVGAAIGAAGWTGARPGELFALERDDVDLTNRVLHITAAYQSDIGETADPKWNSKRSIAILPQAEEILRAVPRHPFSPLVFWSQRGSTFSSRSFHYYWNPIRAAFWNELPKTRKAATQEEAIRERKIPPDFDLYELRHHYGSYLANVLEATPQEIAKQMGHRDGGRLAMERYIHTEQSDANARILERAKRVAEEAERKRQSA